MLPLLKLGTLALRTISRPIARRLKVEAGLHPTFRDYIISFAQANYRFRTNLQRRLYGRATDVVIRPMDEEKAVGAAAELLGELVIFTVAGLAIIYEVQRSARSEARKEEQRRQEIEVNSSNEAKRHRFRKRSSMSKGQTARDGATCPEKKLARSHQVLAIPSTRRAQVSKV
ncbi:PREDICTED: OPA3 [Prunus dulcis]|uniref:PREDICTED: OPA3 n=1 Tax=Prunus dulcis TaxID=3755 RepID=A0A5E4ELS7_PRUDU|nr:PREDICTED: OPA3 [Prunus dulcis]